MPTFDAAAAKAAGYSDQEIKAYLAQNPSGPAATPAARPSGPRPDDLGSTLIDVGYPLAGAVAGGALGAPGGLPGIMLGAGIGGAGGEAWRQNARRMAGYAAPETGGEAARNIGVAGVTDAALAGTLGKGTELLGRVPKPGRLLMKLFGGPAGHVAAAAGDIAEAARPAARASLSAPATVAAESTAPPAMTAADRLKSLGKFPTHGSDAEKAAHIVDLEDAMREMKLDSHAKRAMREALGSPAAPPVKGGRPSLSVVEGGKAPAPARPSASNAADLPESWKPRASAKPEAPAPAGEAKPELLAKPRPEGWDTPLSRHPHGYWSDTNKAKVAIETMSQNHLINAIEKRTAELAAKWGDNAAKRAPTAWSELQALKKELAWRAEYGGVNIQAGRAPAGN